MFVVVEKISVFLCSSCKVTAQKPDPRTHKVELKVSVKSRVIGGNPPAAVLMVVGSSTQEWSEGGLLNDINSVASREDWDSLLPDGVASASKHDGKYVAAPVFLSTVNWR